MSWIIDVALGSLGLTDAQKAQVEAAIPVLDALIKHYNENVGLFNTMLADIQAIAPAAQILADALAKQNMTPSQLLTRISYHSNGD